MVFSICTQITTTVYTLTVKEATEEEDPSKIPSIRNSVFIGMLIIVKYHAWVGTKIKQDGAVLLWLQS